MFEVRAVCSVHVAPHTDAPARSITAYSLGRSCSTVAPHGPQVLELNMALPASCATTYQPRANFLRSDPRRCAHRSCLYGRQRIREVPKDVGGGNAAVLW
jgi:hypothetical protein